MINITKTAFNSDSEVKPVFLLDNIHNLAYLKTNVKSQHSEKYHTVLSQLINKLAEYRPIVLIAGPLMDISN